MKPSLPSGMGVLRRSARGLAWRGGVLARAHRRANRESLTVLMFHRVLPAGSAALRDADPGYAVSDALFAECLAFLRNHYAVVDLDAVAASRAGGPPLPPCALLITFDDGWRCNLEVALPLLRGAGLPATVFVAADALHDPEPGWWQETLLAAIRHGRAEAGALWALAGPDRAPPMLDDVTMVCRFAALDRATRARILAPFARAERDMLQPEDLPRLRPGMEVGSHGASHLPLSHLPPAEAASDLARAASLLGGPRTISFPHGRYDRTVVEAARAAGHVLAFTSEPVLNPAPGGRAASDVLGRISIETAAVDDGAGRLDPARMATWLFRRPVRAVR